MFCKYLTILCFIISWTGCGKASEEDAVATQFYNDGAYDQAAMEWQKLCDAGISDPDVYYNMGIAAAQEGKLPLAVIHLEKAIRYQPGNKEYTSTLEKVRGQISHAVIPVDTFFIADWWRKGISVVSPGIWALIALLLLFLGLIRLLQFHQLIKLKLMALPGQGIFYITTGMLLVLVAFFSYRQIYRLNEGIVFTVCEMKEGPSDQSPFLREVAAGEKIMILDAIPGWTKVNLLNLDEGWIKNECYRVINPEQCQ